MSNKINSELPRIWLNERQAAQYLGVSRTTLYRLRRNGEISFSQYGRLIRYRVEDLEAFLIGNYIRSRNPP